MVCFLMFCLNDLMCKGLKGRTTSNKEIFLKFKEFCSYTYTVQPVFRGGHLGDKEKGGRLRRVIS